MSGRLRWLVAVFFAATLLVVVWYNARKPYVVVLQSYDTGYAWTRDVDTGIDRVLKGRPYTVKRFYMDTKRQTAKAFKMRAGLNARRMIDRWHPDVIIAVDDDAQDFVGRHYAGNPKVKLVFAGVNGEVTEYGYDGAPNVTGIFERKQLVAVKEAILEAAALARRAGPVRVMHIGDRSESVGKDEAFIETTDWAPLVREKSVLAATFAEWQEAVRWARGRVDFIITTNYRALRAAQGNARFLPPREVVRWTMENSPVPVIGTNTFFVEDGGMLAIGTSPYEQGSVAAAMAVQILEKGILPREIPRQYTRQFVVFMNEALMKKADFALPEVYEAFARATDSFLPEK